MSKARIETDLSWLPCSTIEQLYVDDRMSIQAISELLDIESKMVHSRMGECGIEMRSCSEASKFKNRADIDEELLKRLYYENKLSTTQIAKRLNVDQSTISRWLGGEARTQKEAMKLRKGYRKRKDWVKDSNGCWMTYMPDHPRANHQGYVKKQVLVWEKHNGELTEEVIHFVNGNLADTRISNLRAMSNVEHSLFHAYARRRAGTGYGACPPELLEGYLWGWDKLQNERETQKQINNFKEN